MAQFESRLVTKKELRSNCSMPYSPQHIARLEAVGRFLKRLQLGQNRVAGVSSEVDAWISDRINDRDTSVKRLFRVRCFESIE